MALQKTCFDLVHTAIYLVHNRISLLIILQPIATFTHTGRKESGKIHLFTIILYFLYSVILYLLFSYRYGCRWRSRSNHAHHWQTFCWQSVWISYMFFMWCYFFIHWSVFLALHCTCTIKTESFLTCITLNWIQTACS